MSNDVELIMQTLFEKVEATKAFVACSRRFRYLDQVTAIQKPFFCFLEEGESYLYQSENLPVKLVIEPRIFIYINEPNKSATPATTLNRLVKAISDTLKPGPADQGRQTLGNLVSHCRIEGRVIKVPGDVDGDGNGLAVIPIKILTNI